MRAVQASHFHAIPRSTAVTACWLSTRSTIRMSSHKNSCSKFCTGSPTCLNLLLSASTSFSAVQHEIADYPENFHARGKTHCQTSGHQLQMQPTHAAGCAGIAVPIGICGEFKLQIVTASGESVPTNSRVASRYAINLTSAASSGTGGSRRSRKLINRI